MVELFLRRVSCQYQAKACLVVGVDTFHRNFQKKQIETSLLKQFEILKTLSEQSIFMQTSRNQLGTFIGTLDVSICS